MDVVVPIPVLQQQSQSQPQQLSEDAFMKAELKWLLESQTPPLVGEIETIIKTAMGCCTGATDSGFLSPRENSSATLAVTSASSDLVKGFITIDGTAIVKGELTLKLPHYNRGNPVKVTINSARPVFLQQLVKARNYLITALQAFYAFPRASRDRDGLLQLLRQVSSAVNQWLPRSVIPKIMNAQVLEIFAPVQVFSPDLPEDLIVEFHVMHSSLLVSVKALNYHQQGIPLQIQSKILGKFRNIKLDTYKGRPVELLDEVTVESASPRLTTLMRSIKTAGGLCEDLINKIQVFK
ncbi:hypothetical protein HKX48_004755 [Thoreauomyces humboldtii]|nr:hypothetical protein HKX48_004755 [Thoreauomyces humboldtii]